MFLHTLHLYLGPNEVAINTLNLRNHVSDDSSCKNQFFSRKTNFLIFENFRLSTQKLNSYSPTNYLFYLKFSGKFFF